MKPEKPACQQKIAQIVKMRNIEPLEIVVETQDRNVRGILKAKDAPTNTRRRVQFDPLALLLDASLEGEIELVKKVIDKVNLDFFFAVLQSFQVPNPSAANDEGITALHNSVCAGHFDVVR